MAKKKAERRKPLIDYAKQLLSSALPFILENKESIIRKVSNVGHLKKKLMRYITLLVVGIVALFITLEGIGLLISSFFPGLRAGTVQISIGVVLILAILIYNRFGRP
jgi:hypothetical protein